MTPSMLIAAALGAMAGVSGPAGREGAQTSGPTPSDAPITLSTEATPGGVTVTVVGRATVAVTARYALEVASGGNRTVQRGNVRLRPGETTVLLTSRVAGDTDRPWTVRLRVEPEGQPPYEVDRGS